MESRTRRREVFWMQSGNRVWHNRICGEHGHGTGLQTVDIAPGRETISTVFAGHRWRDPERGTRAGCGARKVLRHNAVWRQRVQWPGLRNRIRAERNGSRSRSSIPILAMVRWRQPSRRRGDRFVGKIYDTDMARAEPTAWERYSASTRRQRESAAQLLLAEVTAQKSHRRAGSHANRESIRSQIGRRNPTTLGFLFIDPTPRRTRA